MNLRKAYARYLTNVKYSVRSRCELTARSMFFLFGVKGGLLFLITKKEKSPLKPRCSLNNKNALGRTCPQNRLKPKWFYKVLNPKRFFRAGLPAKGTLNLSGLKKL